MTTEWSTCATHDDLKAPYVGINFGSRM